jgi:hypothetical protein
VADCEVDESVLDMQMGEAKVGFDPFEGLGLVKKDVGFVVFVVPGFELDVGLVELCHTEQTAAGVEEFFEQGKFAGRMVEVFDDFAADDVIIGLGEMLGVGMKKGVVWFDEVALLLKQVGDDGAGSGTKIEAGVLRGVLGENGLNNRGNKGLVAWVVDVIVMG